MANGAVYPLPTRNRRDDAELGTLLGLYHGYDQARLGLARLVGQFGAQSANDDQMRRRIWSRIHRQGIASDLFDAPQPGPIAGVARGAHAAALSAFATVSEQAETVLRRIHARWPELCEDAGGPLPCPTPGDGAEQRAPR